MKRLALKSVAELPFEPGPVIPDTASTAEAVAMAEAHGVEWIGLICNGGFGGWVRLADIENRCGLADAERFPPAAQVTPDSTLRNAMELIMTSRTSVAVINDGGRFGGVVSLDAIRRSLGSETEL
jgi:CBS domain-containing protein